MIVDAHRHVIPAPVLEAAAAGELSRFALRRGASGAELAHERGYAFPIADQFHDAGALAAAVRESGADAAILAPAPPLFGYDLGAGEAVARARLVNDGVGALAAEVALPVAGLATLPMGRPEEAVAELRRAVGELGLIGAEVGARVGDAALDDPRFAPVLEAAHELDALLFVHPHYEGPRPGLEDLYLTNLVGNPLETCLCAARLILSGTLDRLPGLRLLLAHGGGYLPYQAGRLDRGRAVRPELRPCAERPSTYLRRFAYDTVVFEPRALRFLVDLVGADRVAYGTDAPFDMRAGSVEEQLDGLQLDGTERAAIESGTATRLLGFVGALPSR